MRVLLLTVALLTVSSALVEAGRLRPSSQHVRIGSIERVQATGNATSVGTYVVTKNGPISGGQGSLAFYYKGIPYAQPPTGQLRWKPSVAVSNWSGTKNATTWGAGCPQDCELPPGTCPAVQSEDCLTLNVFVPLNTTTASNLPVMVFLPGGRFEQGASGTDLYDGSVFASKSNVIVVTTNYRLGALGYMVADGGVVGNYGLGDQRLALQWVQNNIAAFGGNPGKVTLSGQSAGATSIAAHLVSAPSKGLFQQAILWSNPWSLAMKSTKTATKMGNRLVKAIGCNDGDLACMQSASVSSILAAQKDVQNKLSVSDPLLLFYPWTPCVDGSTLTDQPIHLINQGQWNAMPVVAGSVLNEAKLFIWQASKNRLSFAKYIAALTLVFKLKAPEVIAEYPVKPSITKKNDTRPAMSQLGTDYIFTCPVENVTLAASNTIDAPIYRYQFNHISQYDAWGPMYEECTTAVCHGADLPYIFQPPSGFNFTAAELALSNEMITYFGNFVTSADPNTPKTPSVQWSRFLDSNPMNIEFTTGSLSVTAPPREEQCQFWTENVGFVMYDDE